MKNNQNWRDPRQGGGGTFTSPGGGGGRSKNLPRHFYIFKKKNRIDFFILIYFKFIINVNFSLKFFNYSYLFNFIFYFNKKTF
jgi:hypothetical protein